jgi:hypothetical protein
MFTGQFFGGFIGKGANEAATGALVVIEDFGSTTPLRSSLRVSFGL